MLKFVFGKPLFLYDRNIRDFSSKLESYRDLLKEIEYETERNKSIFLYQQQILNSIYREDMADIDTMIESIGCINELIENYIEDSNSEIDKKFSRVQFTKNDILVTMRYDGRVFSVTDAINILRKEED